MIVLACRLCLSSDCRLNDISKEKGEIAYKDVIEDILRIKVVEEGLNPWLACRNCLEKLKELNLFIRHCRDSYEIYCNLVRRGPIASDKCHHCGRDETAVVTRGVRKEPSIEVISGSCDDHSSVTAGHGDTIDIESQGPLKMEYETDGSDIEESDVISCSIVDAGDASEDYLEEHKGDVRCLLDKISNAGGGRRSEVEDELDGRPRKRAKLTKDNHERAVVLETIAHEATGMDVEQLGTHQVLLRRKATTDDESQNRVPSLSNKEAVTSGQGSSLSPGPALRPGPRENYEQRLAKAAEERAAASRKKAEALTSITQSFREISQCLCGTLREVSAESINFLRDDEIPRDVLRCIIDVTDKDELVRKRVGKENEMDQRSPKSKLFREINGHKKTGCKSSELSQLSRDPFEEAGRITSAASAVRKPQFRLAGCQAVSKGADNSDLSMKLDGMMKMMENVEMKVRKLCEQEMGKKVGRLYARVTGIETTQKEILRKVMDGFNEVTVERPLTTAAVSLPFALPLRNYTEFCEAMAMVQKPEIMEQLQQDMCRVGGKDETGVINRIMCKLFTNNLAMNCSWKGQRSGKYILESTPILKIVHGGAIRNVGFSHITEEVAKDRIQRWLRQASRRKLYLFPEEELANPDGIIYEDEINVI